MISKKLINIFCCIYIFTVFITCRDSAKAQQTTTNYSKKIKAYQKQAHRFEIRKCALYYNEKLVVLDTLKNFEKVLGKDYLLLDYGYTIIYPKNGLQLHL